MFCFEHALFKDGGYGKEWYRYKRTPLPWKVHRQYSTLVLIDTGASIGTSLCYEHGYTGIRFF